MRFVEFQLSDGLLLRFVVDRKVNLGIFSISLFFFFFPEKEGNFGYYLFFFLGFLVVRGNLIRSHLCVALIRTRGMVAHF